MDKKADTKYWVDFILDEQEPLYAQIVELTLQLREKDKQISELTAEVKKGMLMALRVEEKDKEIAELKEQLEQERVKLAGCGCEALGYAKDCNKGDYGYSASFQDVRDLREKYEQLLSRVTVEGLIDIICSNGGCMESETKLATAIYNFIKEEK